MEINRRLLIRLKHDLVELQDYPYLGISVFTHDSDCRDVCLILTPSSGPWTGMALHFSVELPYDWPSSPPFVRASTHIAHPNVFQGYICCDLLQKQTGNKKNYTGGYSPALTLRGLFIQFLTFFSSNKVDQDYGDYVNIGEHIPPRYIRAEDVQKYWPVSGTPLSWSNAPDQEKLRNLWESSLLKSNDIQDTVVRTLIIPGSKEILTESIRTVMGQKLPVHKLEWSNPSWASTYGYLEFWSCDKCPYGSPVFPQNQTTVNVEASRGIMVPYVLSKPLSNGKTSLSMLNDDIWIDLASYLPFEAIVALSIAFPRFHEVIKTYHIMIQQELYCFFLRIHLKDAILGIGISVDTKARVLSSDFDWLSMEAFDKFKVRTSIRKRNFAFFLPLAFNRSHFARAEKEIWKRLTIIDRALREAENQATRRTKIPSNRSLMPPIESHPAVVVLYRMMNNIVVSLMKSCGDSFTGQREQIYRRPSELVQASEKAVVSYCHLFHLLISLSQRNSAVLQEATAKLRDFIDKPESRQKKYTPDLGEFIVLVMLVLVLPPIDPQSPMTWDAIRGKFLEEAMTRNVRWALNSVPTLEVMESGENDFRLVQTFQQAKTSLQLMMFQMTFLHEFVQTYSSNLSELDDNYGFVDKELPQKMVSEIKEIYRVDTWRHFFKRVEFKQGLLLSKEQFCNMLRKTVEKSAALKYHNPSDAATLQKLKKLRAKSDKQYIVA